MTASGGERRPFLRGCLACVVVVDLVSFFFSIGDARAIALAEGIPVSAFTALTSGTAVRTVIIVLGVAGAMGFGRGAGRIWEGMVALGALILLSTAHAQLFGSPWRHLFYSGVCLLGWLLGLAVAHYRGTASDESFARVGSLALLGTAYLNAGISKLVFGGTDWMSGTPIQAVILGQDGLVADGILSAYRAWVVTTPAVASGFSIATIAFELAGPLMIVGPRLRWLVAAGLVLMHANIYLLTPILYWQSMVFLIVFGFSADAAGAAIPFKQLVAIDQRDRTFAAVAAALAICALIAIAHQSRRFPHFPQALSTASTPAAPEPEPMVAASPALRHVGPFSVGQTIGGDWLVESLTLSDGGFVAQLSGERGRAAFEMTCANSEHRSPFDLGAAHVFYSSDREFGELEAVGRAFQAEVRQAAHGDDVCETLVSWRTAAQGGPAS